MRRIARFAFATSVLFLLAAAPPLYADSITITSGALQAVGVGIGPNATLSIAGTGGFTMTAIPDTSIGTFAPFNCWASPCVPGSAIDLSAHWSGGDLLANTVTYQGVTYKGVGGAASDASASVNFFGSVTAPAFTGDTSAFVQAPFTFSGTFYPGVPGLPGDTMRGQGTASLWLTLDRSFGGLSWGPTKARYDFAVTPEPASVLLIGSGLVGILGLARRRRAVRQPRA